jgi:YfiH family protein
VLTCAALEARHVFTTNNLELRDDEREWREVAAFLDVSPGRLLLVRQVHGTTVAVARRGDADSWNRPEADIIVSNDPDVAIGVRVADCAPILMVDEKRGAAGAVHAGWRGAAARVAERGVHAMREQFGSRAGDLVAAIGPCLGQCCGEVGPDVVEAFRRGGAQRRYIAGWFTPGAGDRFQLDLAGANRDQLIEAGVEADRIFIAGLCTKTWAQYLHSYRAAGPRAGRMLAAIRPVSPV